MSLFCKRLFLVVVLAGVSLGTAARGLAQAPKQVEIQGTDQMKYDVTAIEAEPGQAVQITLTNTGKLPKVAMAHNLVILKPGTDAAAFLLAATKRSTDGYIPSALQDQIVVHSKLLGPGESDTITFPPSDSGAYEFICTFPGHAAVGMRGVLTVK